jgi:hypothetical protein
VNRPLLPFIILKRKLLYSILLPALLLAGFPGTLTAQEILGGLWTNATIEKEITKDLDIVFTEEFRFGENTTQLASFFSDAGAEYTVFKGFKAGLFYRFINKRRDDGSYSQAHRIYADLSYRQKVKRFTAGYRIRCQMQYREINRSETGCVPAWYIRQKLHFSYNTKSIFDPYLDGEIWYLLNPAWRGFDNIRISAGVVTRITKNHSVDLGYIYNQAFSFVDPVAYHILFAGYKFSF